MAGSMRISSFFDSHGRMAKTALDLADMTSVPMGGKDFGRCLRGSWKGLSIEVVDPAVWEPAPFVSSQSENSGSKI